MFDAGHQLLETHARVVLPLIVDCIGRTVRRSE